MAGGGGSTAFVSSAEAMITGHVTPNQSWLEQSGERFREEFVFPYALAAIYEGQGKLSPAIEAMKEAERRLVLHLESQPGDHKALRNLARVQRKRTRLEEALPP